MRAALAFLTPLGGAHAPDQRTLSWFPAAGLVVGAAVGAVWWATSRLWPPLVAAAIVVVADLAVTGMLHVDGLVDSADGLLPHLPAERRLEVMAEPTVGAFGVTAAAGAVVLRFAALASLPADIALIAALWCTARTLMAAAGRALPYARGAGLLSAFTGRDWRPVAAYGAALALGCAAASGAAALTAVAVGALAGGGILALARARLGGVTGDVLGAAGIVAETVGLVVAAAT